MMKVALTAMLAFALLAICRAQETLGIIVVNRDDDIVVTSVTPRGPADRAGIMTGDLLVAINGNQPTVDGRTELYANKNSIQITYKRRGLVTTVTVTVGTEVDKSVAGQKLSREFLVAGRRVLTGMGELRRVCSTDVTVCSGPNDLADETGKVTKLIYEAEALRANDADKWGVAFLKSYLVATFAATLEDEGVVLNSYSGTPLQQLKECANNACAEMYKTCKKEADKLFDGGIVPSRINCRDPR